MLAEKVTRRLIEQFSFSLALGEGNNLFEAKKYVLHYWGNKKEWSSFINDFFSKSFQCNDSLEEVLEKIIIEDWLQIPISRSMPSLKKRILKKVGKYLPDRLENYN